MMKDPQTGSLVPVDFSNIGEHLPILRSLPYNVDVYSFEHLIDSSNMTPDFWIQIAEKIEECYDRYDGFVVLHGSDTMAYSASALSFMLENLSKPVVFTGSQLPMGMVRSDGLVLIGKPYGGVDADFSMRIFNADGSEAKMCGNALALQNAGTESTCKAVACSNRIGNLIRICQHPLQQLLPNFY